MLLAQNLFDYENSKKYAQYLLQEKDYDLAIEEYERIIFLQPQDTSSFDILLRLLEETQSHKEVLTRFESYFGSFNTANINFSKTYIRNAFKASELSKLTKFQERSHLADLEPFNRVPTYKLAMELRWDEARSSVNQSIEYSESFMSILEKQKSTSYKSTALAIGMSAIVPGAGKAYAGNLKDGLFSMLFIGVNGWLSYRGFSQKGLSSGFGWAFGSLTTGFYAANLYGSARESRLANHRLNVSLQNDVLEVIDLDFR